MADLVKKILLKTNNITVDKTIYHDIINPAKETIFS